MKNMTVNEVINTGKYGEFADYFWSYITDDHLSSPLSAYGYEACDLEYALKRCEDLTNESKKSHLNENLLARKIPVYTRQSVYEDHTLQEAGIFFFPRKEVTELTKKTDKVSAIVIPGGGFARQWTLIEGFAIAARLNEMGISAFVLMYRTAKKGVLEMAIGDMHQGIRYILDNADMFDVNGSSYILGGFSAGATLSATMATDNLGWKVSSLPKPELIFLGYPAQRMDLLYKIWNDNPVGSPERTGMEVLLNRIVPGEISFDALKPYIIENHISPENCPPLFITANEDDPVVSFTNSKSLYKKALDTGINVRCSFGKKGGHSYGIGSGLEVEGWLKNAVDMWVEKR